MLPFSFSVKDLWVQQQQIPAELLWFSGQPHRLATEIPSSNPAKGMDVSEQVQGVSCKVTLATVTQSKAN